ncbi:hypothetical protein [Bacillus taeanensis]|uniref:Uncharacterized protein n=1 Tax=Bacillus taeanensis TaxID=273032 RepID=A0A366XPG5_9BACI|nr:hypothetical protein [Bacillus taeanensis]RBW67797.1 hypothetical protein DS031_20580 [Bacillus taeanensis]
MLGLLISQQEIKEVEYLLKKEMEELLLDLQDSRINHLVKRALEERYQILFRLFRRFASSKDCLKYMRQIKNG